MEKADIAIIGAGIVGLAVSEAVSEKAGTIYVLEKNHTFGQEASSRNSEVLHAGIYYPPGSLKARTCLEGSRLIFEICSANNIAHKRVGKLIVADGPQELEAIEALLSKGRNNGVAGLEIFDQRQLTRIEPKISARAALYSPNTGIVDSHNLMRYFFKRAQAKGAEFSFNTEVYRIEPGKQGYTLTVRDADGNDFSFLASIVINCAGLNSDVVAALCGIDIHRYGYQLNFCKGQYFRLNAKKSGLINRLIYPLPDARGVSLGIHATPDLGGGLRLGPDARYIQKSAADYEVDQSQKAYFAQMCNRFLPFIKAEDLSADTAGIRAKLQGPKGDFRDFIIADEKDKGLPGLINLIGIDSPGLTASAAIAMRVRDLLKNLN